MGQYYSPVSLDENESLYSHDYGNGLKLMEHSWIGNNFVGAVETLLLKGGRWFQNRFVWAGDYAAPHPEDPQENQEEGGNLYSRSNRLSSVKFEPSDVRYICNASKSLYVDKDAVPVSEVYGEHEYRIHPLPLLTWEGGSGGGDFHGEDPNGLQGSWSRDRIFVSNEIPDGFSELVFDLKE